MRIDIHAETVDADNAPLRAEEGSLHLRDLIPRRGAHSDERGEIGCFLLLDLRHLDAARLCDARGVDVVDLALEDGIEHPFEYRRREKARIDLRDLAVVDDLHTGHRSLGKRAHRAAEPLRERDIGADDAHDFL